MDLGLKGKAAVITGGSLGIGLAVARGLAAEGVHVALCARDEERLGAVVTSIADQYGVRCIGVRADVSQPDDIQRLVGEVERTFGGADILINNAGTGTGETIMDAPDEKWQHFWDLHVMAAVRLSRALAPAMQRRGGGVILNNASICASQPMGHEPIYNVTKAALVMFSKCLANELIPYNIRVNAVNPGLIMTPVWQAWAEQQAAGGGARGASWQAILDQVAQDKAPIGRFASPEELADFMVFLCSPRASYCVGATYYVDGGWLKVTT
jgi:NAD(P)-dependent dehydrogenase (short-subunit alcohol dehydrogenase family)